MLNHGYELKKRNRKVALMNKPWPTRPVIDAVKVVEVKKPDMRPYLFSDAFKYNDDVLVKPVEKPMEVVSRNVVKNKQLVTLKDVLQPAEDVVNGLCKLVFGVLVAFLIVMVAVLLAVMIAPHGYAVAHATRFGLMTYIIMSSTVMSLVTLTPFVWLLAVFYQGLLKHRFKKVVNGVPKHLAVRYLEGTFLNFAIYGGLSILLVLVISFLGMTNPTVMAINNMTTYLNSAMYGLAFISLCCLVTTFIAYISMKKVAKLNK